MGTGPHPRTPAARGRVEGRVKEEDNAEEEAEAEEEGVDRVRLQRKVKLIRRSQVACNLDQVEKLGAEEKGPGVERVELQMKQN